MTINTKISAGLCLGLLLATIGAACAANEDQLILENFERLYISDQTTPPARSQSGWENISLKEIWQLNRRIRVREAWYHTSFEFQPDADESYAIFIARISANAGVWINNVEIGNTGSFADPLPRNWNHPTYIPIPKNLLQTGTNTLDIRLKVNLRRTGMLYEVHLGPVAVLNPIYQTSYFAKITASKILSSFLLLSVVILLTFYFTTKLPKSYFWFALGTAAWTVFSLTFFVRYPLINEGLWDASRILALLASLVFYTLTIHTMFNIRRPMVIKILLSLMAVYALSTLLLPTALVSMVTYIYLYLAQLILVLMAISLCWRGFKPGQAHRGLLLFTGISIITIIVYDLLSFVLDITATFAKFPYLPVVIMLSGAAAFMHRLIRLEREHATLSTQKAEIESTARTDALKKERERLMQEIHDGVGGQLVSTLARLEKNRTVDTGVMETLRTSIDDLRLIVHSLDTLTQHGDVITLLATIRERMEKNLNQQGIVVDWQVQPVPTIDNFNPEHALQLLRIVQEAITNTIKHADANLISLHCHPQSWQGRDGIVIKIHDNGKGFAANDPTVGLGLSNMHSRAEKLQGNLSIQSDSSGTSIELWIPLVCETLATTPV